MDIRYVVITPVRNEEEFIENTILSSIHQTVRPSQWVIVDDELKDRTGSIIDSYARRIPWIEAVHRKDRGFRKSGGGVIEAFYDGYSRLSANDWEFIVKLDGDLIFDSFYFERCFARFQNHPKLGIGGGTVFNLVEGGVLPEPHPSFHVRGATKIYRRGFWENSGGLLRFPGWDTLDEVKANMLGWQTFTFPDIHIFQQKQTGSADGTWKNAVKNGRGSYISGYHPIFFALKCMKRGLRRPFGVEAFGLMTGFLSASLKKLPRVHEKELTRYIRRQQLKRIGFQESIWR